jgi:hypothetical protein
MSISEITPAENVPSIHSVIETVPSEVSEEPANTIDDVLNLLRDLDDLRGGENQALADGIQAIRNELGTLSDYVRQEKPPPVPVKDERVVRNERVARSVGSSRDVVDRAGPSPVEPRLIAIPLTPPPMWSRPSSPSSLSDSASFLSSHHSDDVSLMEPDVDVYPDEADEASSIWTSESEISESLESDRSSFISSASYESLTPDDSISTMSPAAPASSASSGQFTVLPPSEDLHISETTTITESSETEGTYMSRSSSPTGSTVSSGTARPTQQPRAGPSIEELPEILDRIRDHIKGLRDGQAAMDDAINEIRDRGMAPSINDKLDNMENMLNDVLASRERTGPPRLGTDSMYSTGSESSSALDRLADRWNEMRGQREDIPTIYMPTPVPARQTLDEQIEALLSSVPSLPAAPVQAPPAFVPLVYRPVARAARPRSASPVSSTYPPDRSTSAPPPESDYPGFDRESFITYHPARSRRLRDRQSYRSGVDSMMSGSMADYPTSAQGGRMPGGRGGRSRARDQADIDFERRMRVLRMQRRGGDGVMNLQNVPTEVGEH